MAIISGIFNDPFGAPLAGVLIELTARKTTTVSITGTNAAAVTADDGSYSMPVLPGVYAVSAKIGYTPDYLGVIQVYPDSPNGTLNQFLAEFNPDDVTPEVLREMQLILIEAELAAKSAWLAAEKAKQYALIPKGAFDPDAEYQRHDLVEYDGSEYLATADVTGVVPPESPWELFLAAGENGDAGPANTLAIGAVTTLEPGEEATAEIVGDSPIQTLNMGIPAGKTGDNGPPNTLSIGTVTTLSPGEEVTADISGEAPNQTLNMGIPAGQPGDAGPANILAIGTVTTLTPGEEATAEIIGDSPNQTLNMGIPAGKNGDNGPPNSLIIGTVTTLSSSEEATANITGDAPDQVLNMGIPAGKPGEAGPVNTLTIGTVTTGTSDDPAAADISGDAPNQVLNLTIPQGKPGEAAEGAMSFKGLYQYAETYSLNDVVKLSTDGQYICVVETTTAVPGQSTDWQYMGGNINTIDGLGSDENGDMVCNMSVDVSEAVVEPSLAGAASMTLNISSSVTVDLTAFVNPLYNTNPAAILRLVISAGDAIVITFTCSAAKFSGLFCGQFWTPADA